MSVTIKKKKDSTPTTQTKKPLKPQVIPKKAIRKAVRKPTDKDRSLLKQLPTSLEKYHSQSDEELEQFIEPTPERALKPNNRLDREQMDARLVLLHRMLIRKVTPAEIRTILKISEPMYYKLKDQLSARMRLDVSKVDVPYLIGDTLAFYDEVRSMALTMSSSSNIKDHKTKLMAMSVAMKAEQDKNGFLESCGVYSAPVVEHIVRGMVSTGKFSLIDGKSERVIEAGEVNTELFLRLKQFAKSRTEQSPTDTDVLGDSIAINCNQPEEL